MCENNLLFERVASDEWCSEGHRPLGFMYSCEGLRDCEWERKGRGPEGGYTMFVRERVSRYVVADVKRKGAGRDRSECDMIRIFCCFYYRDTCPSSWRLISYIYQMHVYHARNHTVC